MRNGNHTSTLNLHLWRATLKQKPPVSHGQRDVPQARVKNEVGRMPFQRGWVFFAYFFVRVFSQFFSVSLFGDLLASLLRRGGTQPAEDCATIAVLCLLIDVGKVNKILGILFVITVVNTCIGMMICLICLRTTALNDCSIPKHLAVNVVPLRSSTTYNVLLRAFTVCGSKGGR